MSQRLTFEFPLNEKIRNYLRIESIYLLLYDACRAETASQQYSFFRSLFELSEALERAEWKVELIKDLNQQCNNLERWQNVPGVDQFKITSLIKELIELSKKVNSLTKLNSHLENDKLISTLRQRISLPGGTCNFDIPQYYHWCKMAEETRLVDVERWLQPYTNAIKAVKIILKLIREHAHEEMVTTNNNGIYHGCSQGYNLLRIELINSKNSFPITSGHRDRFTIRISNTDGSANKKTSIKLIYCR